MDVISSSEDGTLRVWDLHSRECISIHSESILYFKILFEEKDLIIGDFDKLLMT